MAKRKSGRPTPKAARAKARRARVNVPRARSSGKRPKVKTKTRAHKKAPQRTAKPVRRSRAAIEPLLPTKLPRLDRVRRTLDDVIPTPPSSLNLERHGTAAGSGRGQLAANHPQLGAGLTPAITGGDVDADYENAYFSGDGAPGGDNPTPDQEVVDDIGKALGVQYNDNEELKSGEKVTDRDKHRWELDPASSEDYKDRD
jgi:hypothetical protein